MALHKVSKWFSLEPYKTGRSFNFYSNFRALGRSFGKNFGPPLQIWMAALENGSEQKLEKGKDVFCHPPSSTFISQRIMSDALEEHDGKVSIGGRNITNLRFANDIDALAEEEQELEALVESLDKTCIRLRYKMEISAKKTKLMTNSANGIQREINLN